MMERKITYILKMENWFLLIRIKKIDYREI